MNSLAKKVLFHYKCHYEIVTTTYNGDLKKALVYLEDNYMKYGVCYCLARRFNVKEFPKWITQHLPSIFSEYWCIAPETCGNFEELKYALKYRIAILEHIVEHEKIVYKFYLYMFGVAVILSFFCVLLLSILK